MLFSAPLKAYTDSLIISALGKGMKYADFIAELERLIDEGRAISEVGVTHKDPRFGNGGTKLRALLKKRRLVGSGFLENSIPPVARTR